MTIKKLQEEAKQHKVQLAFLDRQHTAALREQRNKLHAKNTQLKEEKTNIKQELKVANRLRKVV